MPIELWTIEPEIHVAEWSAPLARRRVAIIADTSDSCRVATARALPAVSNRLRTVLSPSDECQLWIMGRALPAGAPVSLRDPAWEKTLAGGLETYPGGSWARETFAAVGAASIELAASGGQTSVVFLTDGEVHDGPALEQSALGEAARSLTVIWLGDQPPARSSFLPWAAARVELARWDASSSAPRSTARAVLETDAEHCFEIVLPAGAGAARGIVAPEVRPVSLVGRALGAGERMRLGFLSARVPRLSENVQSGSGLASLATTPAGAAPPWAAAAARRLRGLLSVGNLEWSVDALERLLEGGALACPCPANEVLHPDDLKTRLFCLSCGGLVLMRGLVYPSDLGVRQWSFPVDAHGILGPGAPAPDPIDRAFERRERDLVINLDAF
jgi:hypothetical protein